MEVNPYQLAAREASRDVSLDVRGFERLAALVCPDTVSDAAADTPRVDVELRFRRDEQGDCHVTGSASVTLALRCGNCGEWVSTPLAARLDCRLIRAEDRVEQRSRSLDVIHCPDDALAIESLIEDDLLLLVPDVPCGLAPDCVHRAESLPAAMVTDGAQADEPESSSPFSALAQLRKTD